MLQRVNPLVPNKLQILTDGFTRRSNKKEVVSTFETASFQYISEVSSGFEPLYAVLQTAA